MVSAVAHSHSNRLKATLDALRRAIMAASQDHARHLMTDEEYADICAILHDGMARMETAEHKDAGLSDEDARRGAPVNPTGRAGP